MCGKKKCTKPFAAPEKSDKLPQVWSVVAEDYKFERKKNKVLECGV